MSASAAGSTLGLVVGDDRQRPGEVGRRRAGQLRADALSRITRSNGSSCPSRNWPLTSSTRPGSARSPARRGSIGWSTGSRSEGRYRPLPPGPSGSSSSRRNAPRSSQSWRSEYSSVCPYSSRTRRVAPERGRPGRATAGRPSARSGSTSAAASASGSVAWPRRWRPRTMPGVRPGRSATSAASRGRVDRAIGVQAAAAST